LRFVAHLIDWTAGAFHSHSLQRASVDDEFLLARILLLITYDTTVNLGALLTDQNLEQSIDEVKLPEVYASVYLANTDVPRLWHDMRKLTITMRKLEYHPPWMTWLCQKL
jgi:hypothetical protein